MKIPGKKEIVSLIILVITVCYANFFTNSFTFEPVYALYPDSVNLYFLQSLDDDTIFRRDPLSMNFKDSFNISSREFPFIGIYYILMRLFPLPMVTKVLSIVLCIAATIIIYKIGSHLNSQNYAFLLSSLFLVYFLSMDSFYGGQSRCFGIFIFCTFLLLFIKERFFYLLFLLPSTIFFYPSLSPTLIVILILMLLFSKKSISVKLYIFLLIISSIIVYFIFSIKDNFLRIVFNNLLTFQSYKYNFPRANITINPYNPLHTLLYFIFNLNEHSKLYIYFTGFLIMICLIIITFKKKEAFHLPKHIWIMLLASTFSFAIIYPVHPVSASRQFVFSMPLFLVFFVSINMFNIIKHKINPAVLVVFIIILFVVLHPKFNDIVDYKKFKTLYNYIKSLPKNSLIAGYPKAVFIRGYPNSLLTESIPFFTKRSIFFADRLRDINLFVYDSRELQMRRRHLIEALYADSFDETKNFILRYNIDYFVLETYIYDKAFIDSLATIDTDTYTVIKDKKYQASFALLRFAKQYNDFKLEKRNYDILVVDAKKIIQAK